MSTQIIVGAFPQQSHPEPWDAGGAHGSLPCVHSPTLFLFSVCRRRIREGRGEHCGSEGEGLGLVAG